MYIYTICVYIYIYIYTHNMYIYIYVRGWPAKASSTGVMSAAPSGSGARFSTPSTPRICAGGARMIVIMLYIYIYI